MRLRIAAAATLLVAGLVVGASASRPSYPPRRRHRPRVLRRRRRRTTTRSCTGARSQRRRSPPTRRRHRLPLHRGSAPRRAAQCSPGWCTARCTTRSPRSLGGLKPFATAVRAPEGASADAAVGQAARDVLVARVPGQAANVQAAYDAFMAGIPDGAAETAGKAVGAAVAAGMLAWRTGDHFDDVVPYVQQAPARGSSSRSHRQLLWTRSCPTCGRSRTPGPATGRTRRTGTTSPRRSPPGGTPGTSPS